MTTRPSPAPTAAAVLMGGGSTRMGSPKQHVDISGVPMGMRMIDLVRNCCKLVVVSGPDHSMAGMEHIADLPAHTGFGPLAGIEAVLASGKASRWIVLPCDMPSLTAATIEQLLGSTAPFAALRSSDNPSTHLQLTLALEVSVIGSITAFLSTGRRAVGGWLETMDVDLLPPPAACELHNINSPDDLLS
ncbi:MAG: molybdenum cofactor guanylyltransferase [Phycisphaerales bacterium]|nr:molybdenum cofactor guanylyltransferase [Phycisphaerales bacterium]